MNECKKKICDDALRYGNIICDIEFRGKKFELIRQYVIEYEGKEYHMTKIDGEWTGLNIM